MFPLTKKWQGDVNTAAVYEIIGTHLKTLDEKLSFYFPLTFTETPGVKSSLPQMGLKCERESGSPRYFPLYMGRGRPED